MAIFSKNKDEAKKAPKEAASSARASVKKATEKKADISSSGTKPVVGEQSISGKILRRVLITEKGTMLSSKHNAVLFEVRPSANKKQIAQAVFESYGVRPVSVRTAKFAGKSRRYGKMSGKRRDWKKAIVTLPEGASISVHDAV